MLANCAHACQLCACLPTVRMLANCMCACLPTVRMLANCAHACQLCACLTTVRKSLTNLIISTFGAWNCQGVSTDTISGISRTHAHTHTGCGHGRAERPCVFLCGGRCAGHRSGCTGHLSRRGATHAHLQLATVSVQCVFDTRASSVIQFNAGYQACPPAACC